MMTRDVTVWSHDVNANGNPVPNNPRAGWERGSIMRQSQPVFGSFSSSTWDLRMYDPSNPSPLTWNYPDQ